MQFSGENRPVPSQSDFAVIGEDARDDGLRLIGALTANREHAARYGNLLLSR